MHQVWDMVSPTEINLRRVLVGHRAAVNVVDFDDKYIVSASGDRTIKVGSNTKYKYKYKYKSPLSGVVYELLRVCAHLERSQEGHCLPTVPWQVVDYSIHTTLSISSNMNFIMTLVTRLVVSGSSDNTIRLWDIECGACLRTLEGHEELVRCIRWTFLSFSCQIKWTLFLSFSCQAQGIAVPLMLTINWTWTQNCQVWQYCDWQLTRHCNIIKTINWILKLSGLTARGSLAAPMMARSRSGTCRQPWTQGMI